VNGTCWLNIIEALKWRSEWRDPLTPSCCLNLQDAPGDLFWFPSATITSVKSFAQVEKFLRVERARIRKSAAAMDNEMVAHLRAIQLHVLSMLQGVDDLDDDDDTDDEPLLEGDDDDAKAFAAELKQLAEKVTVLNLPNA
jgi:hypothetical protein